MMRLLIALATTLGLASGAGCSGDGGSSGGSYPAGPVDIYASVRSGVLAPGAAQAPRLVYVPNTLSGTVTVIDQATRTVLRTFATGAVPQHVVPSYDLSTLWVTNNDGNTLTAIDPMTGVERTTIPTHDPYNMYYTPDGRFAIVVAEQFGQLDFYDARTMRHTESLAVDCRGIDHMEFTADGRFAVGTCEFSGQLVKLDVNARRIVGYLDLDTAGQRRGAMPQDIRSSADGRAFYVADMTGDGVHVIDPIAFQRVGFIATGKGAHGIVPSRDGQLLYVTNRGWNTIAGGRHGPGSVSVLDPRAGRVLATWPIPDGGSPDMGNLSTDGKLLWVSGRYDDEVYVIDTETGKLLDRIPVGRQPHGLCVWPQPGRFSLGHTGNMR